MENNQANEVTVSGLKEADCSETTTVEIKIKTLDSQTYTLRVNKRMPVPALKEQIATVTGVLSDQQRLICRGKVLKDDQLLSAYHVEDGHTLHLVVRQPFQSTSSSLDSFTGLENSPNDPAANPAPTTFRNHSGQIAHSVVIGTVNLADQGDPVTSDLSRIFSTLFGSFGVNNGGTGSERVDARDSERHDRTPGVTDASDPTQPQPNQSSGRSQFDPQHNASPYTNADSFGHQPPTVIPDSLTTLMQYLSHMRHEFNAHSGRGHNSNLHASSMHGGEHNAHLQSPVGQGLPTPAALVEVMLSARQLLMEQAAGCLSELARQLEEQANLTDPLARTSIQSRAMRSGSLFQNLGSLLLELGRSIMTLRMGQTPSEAVVNAGPAMFVSAAGPNPIMVQAGTSFGGIPMGPVHAGHDIIGGTLGPGPGPGPGFLPRNIDIRFRRAGQSIPVTTANLGEQGHAQQSMGRTDPARSGESTVHQAFQEISSNASVAGESGIRVVPVRTVIAVPSGVGRSPSDAASSGVRLLYPLLARYQQQNPQNSTNTSSQASVEQQLRGSEVGQQPYPDSAVQIQTSGSNNGTTIGDANVLSMNPASLPSDINPATNESSQDQQGTSWLNNNSPQTHDGPQNGQESMAQMFGSVGQLLRTIFPGEQIRISDISFQHAATNSADQTGTNTDAEAHEAPRASDDGVFFSSLVRELMPFISHGTSTEPGSVSPTNPGSSSSNTQTERRNSSDSRSPQHCCDPPIAPDSKRQKRE